MPLSYAQNKKHILKWRENNKDKYREIDRIQHRKIYHWKKIKTEFLSILIDF
jgi:hypothetical protein